MNTKLVCEVTNTFTLSNVDQNTLEHCTFFSAFYEMATLHVHWKHHRASDRLVYEKYLKYPTYYCTFAEIQMSFESKKAFCTETIYLNISPFTTLLEYA